MKGVRSSLALAIPGHSHIFVQSVLNMHSVPDHLDVDAAAYKFNKRDEIILC